MNITWKQKEHYKKEDLVGEPIRFDGQDVGVIIDVKDRKVTAKIYDEFAEKIAAIIN